MAKHVGWKVLYWSIEQALPNCSSKDELTMFQFHGIVEHIPKQTIPCKYMQKNYYSYNEYEIHHILPNESHFEVRFNFNYSDKSHKELKNVKAYGFKSLVGNEGGYLVLFLGCALVQAPQILVALNCWLNKLIH